MGEFMKRPSLKHRGKSIIGSKDGDALVVSCPLDIKEVLLDAKPNIYFETDHCKGYPAIAVDMALVAAQILLSIQTVVSCNIDPIKRVVLTVGTFKTDSAASDVIAHEVRMEGTVRTLDA